MPARIPIYDESVPLETGGTPTPHLPGMPESASGVNVAEAAGHLGATVERGGSELGRVLAYKTHLDAQERAYDLGAKAASDIQNKLYGGNGLLTRQGAQAHGILSGSEFVGPVQAGQQRPDGIKYDDSFDGFSAKLKDSYMQRAGGALTQKLMTRYLDSHITIARNAVVKHEAEQGKVAYHNSIESQVQALMDTGASAVTVGDLSHAMDQGDELRTKLATSQGADADTINAVKLKTADEFAETAVKANLERDPQAAQQLLDGVKGRLSQVGNAKLQTIVDGKMLELRRGAVWDQVKGFTHDDGTIDIGRAEDAARKLVDSDQVPPGQRQHIVDFVKQQASVSDAALRDQRQSQNRQFYNDALKAKNNGLPFEKAEEILFKQKGYGFDDKDRDDKRHELMSLYTKDESFYDNALKHQTPEQQLAWQQIQKLATAKYGKQEEILPGDEATGRKTPLGSAFLLEMKHQTMGMPADQMLDLAVKKLDKVTTDPGVLWDTKKPAWQVDRDVHRMQTQQRSALESRYGGDLVTQANAYLVNQGITNPSPKDIKSLLERMHDRGR